MRFFSKFIFICNLCFGVMVISSLFKSAATEKVGSLAPLSFLHGTAVILGLLSILFNAFFCFITLMLIKTQKMRQVPVWIIIANFIFLVAEIYWFFISKSK